MKLVRRRARLWHRQHLGRTSLGVGACIADLVAMHSSDPITPHLGLWARVVDYTPEHLHDALDTGRLWRLHAMRRTLWIVDAAEVGVMDGAASRTIAARERKRVLGWIAQQQPDAESWLEGLAQAALEAIRAEPGIATRTLTDRVPDLSTRVTLGTGKWSQEAAIGSRLLFLMAMDLDVARTAPAGTWRSSQYGWVATDDRVPERVAADRARAALVGRYVGRFGPVTTTDVKWWTGLTVAQTRKALHAAGAVGVDTGGTEAWVLDDGATEPPPAEGVALLPGLDPTPMGYKERDWFLGAHEADLFDRNGNIGPTVWVDGRIVGGWAVTDTGEVRVRLLEDVAPARGAAIDDEAHALTGWLGGTSVTPRFRTPLEKALTRSP